jgi:maleate isomerase
VAGSDHPTSVGPRTRIGRLSGRSFLVPDANTPPIPALAQPGVIHDGGPAEGFGGIDPSLGYPDVRSFRLKFGLLVPVTNTSTEHELWSIIGRNPGPEGLAGIGLHTANVMTPRPRFGTAAELAEYQRQFLGGLRAAVDQALAAEPQYLILGMSLEHIIGGLDGIRAATAEVTDHLDRGMATWHDAAHAALTALNAKRIGLLTAFNEQGNNNAARMFTDLGFEVVTTASFPCELALHIAHLPDWAKEKAIVELLATPRNRLDAVVQCGTNMSLMQVTERLEPVLGLPIVGVNAALFWYALRENGLDAPLLGAGMLLREH